MGLDIVSNTMATEASNDIATNESSMQSSLEKLSSGYQINSPADDASGYVISQHLQAQISGFQQAQQNTQAGINVVQTADGALNEVNSILQRINSLAVQSANTSATDGTAQQATQDEVNQALTSIADIAQTTVYGDKQLLVNGTNNVVNYTFQVGADGTSSSQVTFSITALNLANLGFVSDSLQLGSAAATAGVNSVQAAGLPVGAGFTVNVTSTVASTAQLNSGGIQGYANGSFMVGSGAITFNLSVNGSTSVQVTFAASTSFSLAQVASTITADLVAVGYSATAVTVNVAGGSGTTFNLVDALGGAGGSITISGTAANLASLGLTNATFSQGTSTASVNVDGGTAVNVTTGQNAALVSGNTIDVGYNGTTFALNVAGPLANTTSFLATAEYNGYADVNNASSFSITSSTAIQTLASAIQTVSSIGGTLGAIQNELSDVSDNESVMVQNLQSSNAQIADTNMAQQMVKFTQDQTLVQAGVSMLAQANQIPQYVLKLLG